MDAPPHCPCYVLTRQEVDNWQSSFYSVLLARSYVTGFSKAVASRNEQVALEALEKLYLYILQYQPMTPPASLHVLGVLFQFMTVCIPFHDQVDEVVVRAAEDGEVRASQWQPSRRYRLKWRFAEYCFEPDKPSVSYETGQFHEDVAHLSQRDARRKLFADGMAVWGNFASKVCVPRNFLRALRELALDLDLQLGGPQADVSGGWLDFRFIWPEFTLDRAMVDPLDPTTDRLVPTRDLVFENLTGLRPEPDPRAENVPDIVHSFARVAVLAEGPNDPQFAAFRAPAPPGLDASPRPPKTRRKQLRRPTGVKQHCMVMVAQVGEENEPIKYWTIAEVYDQSMEDNEWVLISDGSGGFDIYGGKYSPTLLSASSARRAELTSLIAQTYPLRTMRR